MCRFLLFILTLFPSILFAQGNPAAMYQWNGSAWTPIISTGTAQALTWSPPPLSMYCFNTGLAQWVAADSSCFGGGGGTGTVTSFSAGTLSPLFTTSVATATTTPALSFSLSTAAANTAFGNFTGSTAAPSYTATTGTGSPVAATSPTLITPILGVAVATSINKMAITTPATGNTLTIADGKTLTTNNSLTLAGTDGTTMTFPGSSDTVVTLGATQTLASKTFSAPNIGAATGTSLTLGTVSAISNANATAFRVTNTGIIGASSTSAFNGGNDVGWDRAAANVWEADTGLAQNSLGSVRAASFQSAGTKFTATGCTSITSTVGGATAGQFVIGASTCTVVITMNGATGLTAPNGWACGATDETTAAGNTGLYFSSHNTTTATLTVPATAVASDVIVFRCNGY